jgi:hypothetical protein
MAALTAALFAATSFADSVIDWRTYKASPATTLAGQGTDDPIIGDLSTTAAASFAIGYLSTPVVLGPNSGDSITFSFGVSFNDTTGMANAGDNFRFALFDLNGEGQDSPTGGSGGGPNYDTAGTNQTDNFRGYWFGVRNGTGTGSGGSMRERIAMLASGQNAFAATGANSGTVSSLGAVGGDPVTLVSDVNGDGAGPDYTGVMTLTRNASGLVDLSGSFIGTNGATGNVFTASDSTPNDSSTYGAVGFLFGGPLNVEQVLLQNVSVSVGAPSVAGDYNGNGSVDAADYVLWRDGGPLQNEVDTPGTINGADYTEWRARFGSPSSGLGGGASVPEPASGFLLALAALTAYGARRPR